jgi:hypothetical protein
VSNSSFPLVNIKQQSKQRVTIHIITADPISLFYLQNESNPDFAHDSFNVVRYNGKQ